jgi:hypothetical protein
VTSITPPPPGGSCSRALQVARPSRDQHHGERREQHRDEYRENDAGDNVGRAAHAAPFEKSGQLSIASTSEASRAGSLFRRIFAFMRSRGSSKPMTRFTASAKVRSRGSSPAMRSRTVSVSSGLLRCRRELHFTDQRPHKPSSARPRYGGERAPQCARTHVDDLAGLNGSWTGLSQKGRGGRCRLRAFFLAFSPSQSRAVAAWAI